MEKIDFYQACNYLKDNEMVYIISSNHITYFYISRNRINVISDNCRYYLSAKQFKELFINEDFYLYKNTEEGIDEEKDKSYYDWKNRGVN